MYKASVNTEANGNNNTVPSSDARTAYSDMSREELLDELLKSKIAEARAKKGYEVKGVGANKEYIPINNANSK